MSHERDCDCGLWERVIMDYCSVGMPMTEYLEYENFKKNVTNQSYENTVNNNVQLYSLKIM